MMRSTRTVAALLAILIIVAAALADTSRDRKRDLQEAYIKGMLSLEEFVARKDSVLSQINTEYQKVRPIMEHSCFDCHSSYTNYPWYHSLPVLKGMIDEDIADARDHLDLSDDFPFAGRENLLGLLEEIKEEIGNGDMPPFGYRLTHWGRLVENEERDSLFNWIDSTTLVLNNFYESLMPPVEEETD